MHHGFPSATTHFALALVSSLAVGCADPGSTTGPVPSANTSTAAGSMAVAGKSARLVSMMDACDGPSFNAVLGAGECARRAGMNFSAFIAELTRNQSVGAWHSAPVQMDAKVGETLQAVNLGGEVHTFTRVANFGGGVVPLLNTLSGTPNVAPECLAETAFVPPGGTDTEVLDQAGTMKFQCCIHPWMRTTVRVGAS